MQENAIAQLQSKGWWVGIATDVAREVGRGIGRRIATKNGEGGVAFGILAGECRTDRAGVNGEAGGNLGEASGGVLAAPSVLVSVKQDAESTVG